MSNTPKAYHGYFGGKTSIGKNFIINYIPKNFKTYVEPFSGSFAVYFFTPMNDDVKAIYNDYNKDQANLFYCSRNYDKFLKILEYHLYDKNGKLYCKEDKIEDVKSFYKELYYSYKRSDFSQREFELGDYDRAAEYAFLLTSAFNSVNYMAGGFSGFNKDRIKILSLINKLNDEYVRGRLDKISEVHSMDFEELIKKYDSPDTYFYLDPPYYTGNEDVDSGKRVGWYGASDIFDVKSHKRLCDLLKTLKGKWSLSYYDFDLLHEWLPEDKYTWVSKDFFRSSASFSDSKETKGTELLIMNYELTDEEIEENKKFLGITPKKNSSTTAKKNLSTDMKKKTKKIVDEDEFINFEEELLDEKLIDEIEEENGGAFINSDIEEKVVENISKLIKNQKDLDPEFNDIVNEHFDELIDNEGNNKSDKSGKSDDIDDFWLS